MWGSAPAGTWEWLVGVDYNNDGETNRTLKAFGKIANNRNDLYALDKTLDGKVWQNNLGHTTRDGAEAELESLTIELRNEGLLKYCNVYIVGISPLYHVEINYSPAYFMRDLANLATDSCSHLPVPPYTNIGHDVKGRYALAKGSFLLSSGRIGIPKLGGMTDPHLPITYYLIVHNDFRKRV